LDPILRRILVFCTAGATPVIALVADGKILRQWRAPQTEGLAASLPEAVAQLMANEPAPDAIAAITGPGSFTGIRAGLALAAGLANGFHCKLIGVTQSEAFAQSLPNLDGRALWTAIDSKRGRVFLDRGEGFAATDLATLKRPAQPIAVAGDAALEVVATLAARDANVMLTSQHQPDPLAVAAAAQLRHQGALPPLPAEPLYVDAPAVTGR
jgi:tRNA threonylcarbamoyladenosine biosynthesis protein TsaB